MEREKTKRIWGNMRQLGIKTGITKFPFESVYVYNRLCEVGMKESDYGPFELGYMKRMADRTGLSMEWVKGYSYERIGEITVCRIVGYGRLVSPGVGFAFRNPKDVESERIGQRHAYKRALRAFLMNLGAIDMKPSVFWSRCCECGRVVTEGSRFYDGRRTDRRSIIEKMLLKLMAPYGGFVCRICRGKGYERDVELYPNCSIEDVDSVRRFVTNDVV